jgi:uncharacterized protein
MAFKGNHKLKLDFSHAQEWLSQQQTEDVCCRSDEGLKLHGVLIRRTGSHLYFICLHGYRGMWHTHTDFASFLDERIKANYLFIDQRASGTSEGKYLTMGYKESQDLRKWIEYAEKCDEKAEIVLYGVSLGGSTVLADLNSEDPKIKAAIADSAFSDAFEECVYIARRSFGPFSRSIIFLVNLLSKMIMKVNLKDGIVQKSLKEAKVPVLLIHSKKDTFVPYANLEKNYLLLPSDLKKEKAVFEDSPHALNFYFSRQEYLDDVIGFLKELKII